MTDACLLLADGASRAVFEWGRIQSNRDWLLPLAACALILAYVRWMYRRDAVELRPWLGWLLTVLRAAALVGLLILYLQPQWRSEREATQNSRALILVDTSSSMGITDQFGGGEEGSGERGQGSGDGGEGREERGTGRDSNDMDAVVMAPDNRAAQVAAALATSDFLDRLRNVHDVTVFRFDEKLGRVASLEKSRELRVESREEGFRVRGSGFKDEGLGTGEDEAGDEGAKAQTSSTQHSQLSTLGSQLSTLEAALVPTGSETRLGDALGQLVDGGRGEPVSAIVLFSDGGQNAGASVEAAVDAARNAGIPIFSVGVGSNRQRSNVRIYKLDAPPRAYPGDPFTVTALVQVEGDGTGDQMSGKSATVQLLMRSGGESGDGTPIDSRQIVLGQSGQTLPVSFERTTTETGRRTFRVRVIPPVADRDAKDDFRETDVEVVGRKDRVLLFAGGPSREYQFLRSLLFRDASMKVDILLQTAGEGVSQESDAMLNDFPATREEMFAYDCLVAVDPDWRRLSLEQVKLLEAWVGEQGGGMIAVPGPIYAGETVTGWVQTPEMATIRDLYPVEFQRRGSVLSGGFRSGHEPWALDFTREGLEADYLWLDDTATSSLRAWELFAGVYSHCPVRGAKPAATVLARFSDPSARAGGEAPVYFAEQFFGSGRVFYLGSGEMWRLREVGENAFERFYTRLIRHVAQGRLLRQSSRGTLLVGQDTYGLGKTVEVRAQLTDARLAPLAVDEVALDVVPPDGGAQSVVLRPTAGRAGTYTGQFTVLQEGTYRLELPVPDTSDQRLTRRIQVTMPDLERQDPRRNDKLLARVAAGTGGRYYESIAAALGPASIDPLVDQLRDRTKTVIFSEAPNPAQQAKWLQWLMLGICGTLSLEWLLRRMYKLS